MLAKTERSMSAANSPSPAARRNVAPTMRQPAPPQTRAAQAAAQPSRIGFASNDSEPEIKLNLADIPRAQETLDVEGFKPTLLSRLFDLISPNR
jgi:hypothetical protein